MAKSVRLDDSLVSLAKAHALAELRTIPKQIEYWARIGKELIDNPDLTYTFVKEAKLATEEAKVGDIKKYRRRTKR